MLRSMQSAIGAISLEQTAMDNISNNIANVNTQGYKSSRANFQDLLSQTLSYGAQPTATRGGLDPTQIGLGVRLGGISRSFTQGALLSTGRNFDLAVQGDGFFVYQDPNSANNTLYSRDGQLEMDSQGYLVNIATGYRILGWTADTTGTVNTGQAISSLKLPLNQTKARATSQATLSGNLDTNLPIYAAPPSTNPPNYYDTTISLYDSLGVLQNLTVRFTKASVAAPPATTAATWDWKVTTAGATGAGTVTFDSSGKYILNTIPAATPITIPGSNGAQPITLSTNTAFDLSNLTQLSSTSNVALANQNGLAAAAVQNFTVDSNNGDIYAVYGNGLQDRAGRIALSTFTNPEGLTQLGKNMYSISLNSGAGAIGWPGNGGKGTLAVGYNEGSNVDLGREFTNMILAQRAFQAASRMITTSDEMLQELIGLKR